MSKLAERSSDIFLKYKKLVILNSESLSDFEQAFKWISYLLAGRINSSNILSELTFSVSNLLVLLNDRIISNEIFTKDQKLEKQESEYLEIALTVLEYCEVFIELSFKKLFGYKGKFLIITVIQVLKCIGRLLLYLKHNKMASSPTVPPLNRKKLKFGMDGELIKQDFDSNSSSSVTFKLKRSGKVIRKVANAPSLHGRDFKQFNSTEEEFKEICGIKVKSAELLYIFKPLIHLGSAQLFGLNGWKSFTTSLLLDLVSVRMYYNHKNSMSLEQKKEVSRRCVAIMLYIFKSPFYDKYSKNKIESFLFALAKFIPFSNPVVNPLISYIPQWQSTYFYLWSS